MSEIDELEGVELAESVARALGLEHNPAYRMWWGGRCIDPGAQTRPRHAILTYRPDLYMDQAWELVDGLWEQRCDFIISREGTDMWWAEVHDLDWYDKETTHTLVSEMMYGTAPEVICRAFLKAKAAQ